MDAILKPFAIAISWVWYQIHNLLTLVGLPTGPGVAWIISIVLLTILVRLLVLPLFIKQIKSSRGMMTANADIQKLQAKYKGKTDQASKMKQSEEMQEIYKKHGTNPMASCWPMLVQMPILFAMYRAIWAIKPLSTGSFSMSGQELTNLGPIDQATAQAIDQSKAFGVPLTHTLADEWASRGVMGALPFVICIIILVALQFLTMRLSMTKNMAPSADPNNPMVRSQKTMMYMMPLMFVFSGFFFQMGIMVYMLTGTTWAYAQQLWAIKTIPTPKSPAYIELTSSREGKYRAWAKPFFEEYDEKKAALSVAALSDEERAEKIEDLNVASLATIQQNAKRQKVSSDFPESMSAGEKVAVYRNLANQDWEMLPDEFWMRGVKRAVEKAQMQKVQAEQRAEAMRRRAKKKGRPAPSQAEIAAAVDAPSIDEGGASSPAGGGRSAAAPELSPEEIERRRIERQRARRQAGKKKKKGGRK